MAVADSQLGHCGWSDGIALVCRDAFEMCAHVHPASGLRYYFREGHRYRGSPLGVEVRLTASEDQGLRANVHKMQSGGI